MKNIDNLKLENQLCFLLYVCSKEIIRKYKPFLGKLDLTYTQYIVMLVLWEEKKASVKQIGNRLHLDSGTLTPLLKKLEAMEFIKRYRDKSDDRVVIAELTDKGAALQEKAREIPNNVLCNIKLTSERALDLKKSLDEVLENLE